MPVFRTGAIASGILNRKRQQNPAWKRSISAKLSGRFSFCYTLTTLFCSVEAEKVTLSIIFESVQFKIEKYEPQKILTFSKILRLDFKRLSEN